MYSWRKWVPLVAALFAYAFAMAAQANDGRVISVRGNVTVNGNTLTRATRVGSGDTIATGPRSSVKVMMKDSSVLDIKPNTRFEIENYSYEPNNSSGWRSAFNLFGGAVRFVTGAISKLRSDRLSLRAGVATIGIRGSFQLLEFDGVSVNITAAVGTATITIPGRPPVVVGNGSLGSLNLQTAQQTTVPAATSTDPVVQTILSLANTPADQRANVIGQAIAAGSPEDQALLMAATTANASALGLSGSQLVEAVQIAATANPDSAPIAVFIISAISPSLSDDALQGATDVIDDAEVLDSLDDAQEAGSGDLPPPGGGGDNGDDGEGGESELEGGGFGGLGLPGGGFDEPEPTENPSTVSPTQP